MKLRLVSATLGIAIVAQTSCSPTVGSGAAALSGAPQSRQVPGIEGVIRVVRLVSAIVFPGQNLITAQILSKYFVSRNGTTQPEFMKIAARFSTAVSGTVDDLSGAKADTAIRAALRDFGLSAEGMIQAGGTQRTLVSVCRQIFALGKLLSFVNLPWLKTSGGSGNLARAGKETEETPVSLLLAGEIAGQSGGCGASCATAIGVGAAAFTIYYMHQQQEQQRYERERDEEGRRAEEERQAAESQLREQEQMAADDRADRARRAQEEAARIRDELSRTFPGQPWLTPITLAPATGTPRTLNPHDVFDYGSPQKQK